MFETGKVFATSSLCDESKYSELAKCFWRHIMGDWGDLCDDDKRLNDLAIESGDRIFSAYNTSFGKIYIITEADRSYTILLS